MKTLINGTNRDAVYPIVHQWAWDASATMLKNHWGAKEVNMSKDISDIKQGKLSERSLKQVKTVIAFFLNSEGIIARGVMDVLRRHTTSSEYALALITQAFQESAIHTEAYRLMLDILADDQEKLRLKELAETLPVILSKNYFADKYISKLDDSNFKLDTLRRKQDYVIAIFVFSAIIEGAFFYTGFAQTLAFKQFNLLRGCSEQIEFICRDEAIHSELGRNALNQLRVEDNTIFTEELEAEIQSIVLEAVKIEDDYIDYSVANDILGFNPALAKSYVREMLNRRLAQTGFQPFLKVEHTNPLPWLSNIIDLKKEKNFFESSVTEYQGAQSLSWD